MPDMIETTPISDTFVTVLAKMEWVGGSCLRFYFCNEQDGELVLQSKFVVPIECVRSISAARLQMMAEIGAAKGVVIRGSGEAA